MSGPAAGKRCTVVYATRERQYLWTVQLPPEATIGDALVAARRAAGPAAGLDAGIWDSSPVGIFGEPRERGEPCADGDRIEIYRPLTRDPRARRRERLARERRRGARAG
ncbi:MAG TPA: RnfH family protein [Steroidobacteraceae bacterium]|nr:RnfH family protein [Steroidobacteraceae bacterium]